MKQDIQSGPYGWNSINATPAHDYLLPAIQRLLPPRIASEASRVLDIGCGNGYVASRLNDLGYEVIGIDQALDGVALARRAYPHIRFEVVSVYEDICERLGESAFELVVSSEVIEHLYFPRKLLEQAWLALRPGGTIIVTTPFHGYLKNLALSLFDKWDDHHTVGWDGGHIKFFSQKTLAHLLREAGFADVRFANAGRVPWLWKSMVCRAARAHR